MNELIKAVDEALPQEVSCPGFEKTILKAHIVQILEILLTNNYFTFDNKLYHQTTGAPFDAIPSPEICDIGLYQVLEQLSENTPHKNKIKIHARFRDDGFMILEKAPAHEVSDFFQTANNFHNLLRFTRTTTPQEIAFLDTTVYKGKRFRLKRTGYQNMHQTN